MKNKVIEVQNVHISISKQKLDDYICITDTSISADDEQCQSKLKRHYVHGYSECQTLVGEAVDDAFKRLLKPSIETEFAALSKQKADEEAIVVFC